MLAIIDYGAGNLFSVKNALDFIGVKSVITHDRAEILAADKLILPGVGAFPKAMSMLNSANLTDTIKQAVLGGTPLLGICLGMQLLFDYGLEFEPTKGLELIDGHIQRIETDYKIPHMGYNQLEFNMGSSLLNGVNEGESVYFVHSFMAKTKGENVAAYCDYGSKIPALVQKGNVYGAQFHPEKSDTTGLKILANFSL